MELRQYATMVVAMTASGLSSPTISVIFCAMLWKKGTTSICIAQISSNAAHQVTSSYQFRSDGSLEYTAR
jgi:hypothetical protein